MGKVKDRMVKLTGEGADAQYLTWNQVPDTVRFEAETLTNMAYDMSNTPRISFETLKGEAKHQEPLSALCSWVHIWR